MRVRELPPGPERAPLRPLLELADDAPSEIDRALIEGRLFVAIVDESIVGSLLVGDSGARGEPEVEIRSLAIAEAQQGRGLGRALVTSVLARLRAEGIRRVRVATAIAGLGVVRFYLRLGFRAAAIERDAFTPARGYPPDLFEDGIPIRDRIWFDLDLDLE